jgi:hypothetical protein
MIGLADNINRFTPFGIEVDYGEIDKLIFRG